MTDEDSDDDNDRMERANRIREMREGRRRGAPADEDADDETDTGTASAETDEQASADPETEPPEPAEGSGASPEAETTDDTEAETTDDTEAVADQSTATGDADESADESGFEFAGDDPDAATQAGEKVETGEPATDAERVAAADSDTEGGMAETQVESGIAESVTDTDAAEAVDDLGVGGTFAIPDQATTVSEEDEQAMLEEAEQSVAAARAAVGGREATHATDRTRVLEFELSSERFCLDIDYIEEIVELENMTRVPNSPSYVEGVVDLRGQVTAIINPKDALEVDNETQGDLIVVFDSEKLDEQGNLGWVVDEVRQVTPVSEDEVNESPDDEDDEHINGIINREDEDDFIVWTTPDLALNSS